MREEYGKRRSALRAAADLLTAKEIGRDRKAARPFFRIPAHCVLSFLPSAVCGKSHTRSRLTRTRDLAQPFIGVPSGLVRVAGSTHQDRDYTTDESATRAGAHRGRITRVHRVDPAPITEAREGEVNIVQSCEMH